MERAARVGAAGKLPVHATLALAPGDGAGGANSSFRLAEVWRRVELAGPVPPVAGPVPPVAGPVLLVLDRCDSRWTSTVAAHRLLSAGTGPVLPFALARV